MSIERPLCDTWHTYTREGTDHLKRTEWFLMRAPGMQRLQKQASENITRVEWMDGAGVEAMKQNTYPAILTVISAWEEMVHRSRTDPVLFIGGHTHRVQDTRKALAGLGPRVLSDGHRRSAG